MQACQCCVWFATWLMLHLLCSMLCLITLQQGHRNTKLTLKQELHWEVEERQLHQADACPTQAPPQRHTPMTQLGCQLCIAPPHCTLQQTNTRSSAHAQDCYLQMATRGRCERAHDIHPCTKMCVISLTSMRLLPVEFTLTACKGL